MRSRAELYRHFDVDGRLLYVGVTISTLARTVIHATQSHWYSQVSRIEIERFASVEDALKAESVAIICESPFYNKTVSKHKAGRPRLELVAKTLRATKPWLELGMSERTWYRRQAERNRTNG